MTNDIKRWLRVAHSAEQNYVVQVPDYLTEEEIQHQLNSVTKNWERTGDFVWFEDANPAAFFRLKWGEN